MLGKKRSGWGPLLRWFYVGLIEQRGLIGSIEHIGLDLTPELPPLFK
jgi:hypothetical protein